MGIFMGIAPFEDPMTKYIFLQSWGYRKRFPRRRFGDEILSSSRGDSVPEQYEHKFIFM
jgi:hypothetical protein